MRTRVILVGLLGLVACDADGNPGREESAIWHQRTSIDEKVAFFQPRCEAYGFVGGSPQMAACVQKEIQDSAASARARVQAAAADMSPPPPRQRMPITCTTIGNTTQCF